MSLNLVYMRNAAERYRKFFIPYILPFLAAAWALSIVYYLVSPVSRNDAWFRDINFLDQLRYLSEMRWILAVAVVPCVLVLVTRFVPFNRTRDFILIGAAIGAVWILGPWIRPLLLILAMIAVTEAMGRRFVRWGLSMPEDDPSLHFVVVFVVGLIPLLVEILALSFFQRLQAAWIIALLGLKAFVLRRDFPHTAQRVRADLRAWEFKEWTTLDWMALVLCGAYLSYTLAYAVLPPVESDEISYHMYYAKLYSELNGYKIFPTLDLTNGYRFAAPNFWVALSMAHEAVLSYLYTIGGYAACKLFQFFNFVLILGGVIEFARRHLSLRAGLLAALLLASTPMLNCSASTTYNEINMTLFGVAALLVIGEYLSQPLARRAALLGLVLGVALSVKLTAVYWIGSMGLILVLNGIVAPRERFRGLFHAVLMGTATVLVAGFWYFRNWMIAGDPLFPIPGTMVEASVGGVGANLLRYAWNVFFNAMDTGLSLHAEGNMGFMLFGLIPFVFAYPCSRDRKTASLMGLAVILYYFSVHMYSIRYMLPVLPIFSLLAAAGFCRCVDASAGFFRVSARILFLLAAILQLFYYRASWAVPAIPMKYLIAPASADEFYRQSHLLQDKYSIATAVNKYVTSPRDRILEIGWTLVCPYFSDAVWINISGNNATTNPEISALLADCRKGAPLALKKLLRYLASRDVKFLVVPESVMVSLDLKGLLASSDVRLLEKLPAYEASIFRLQVDSVADLGEVPIEERSKAVYLAPLATGPGGVPAIPKGRLGLFLTGTPPQIYWQSKDMPLQTIKPDDGQEVAVSECGAWKNGAFEGMMLRAQQGRWFNSAQSSVHATSSGDFNLDATDKAHASFGLGDQSQSPEDHFDFERLTEDGRSFTRIEARQDTTILNLFPGPKTVSPSQGPITFHVRMRSNARAKDGLFYGQVVHYQQEKTVRFETLTPLSEQWSDVIVLCRRVGDSDKDYCVCGIRGLAKGEHVDFESWEILSGLYPVP